MSEYNYNCTVSDSGRSYIFETDKGNQLEVYFYRITQRLIESDLDNYPSLKEMYTIGIIKTIDVHSGIDYRIKKTIGSIIKHFYTNTSITSVIYYNCDDSDNKHAQRNNTFHKWFFDMNDCGLCKIDSPLEAPEEDGSTSIFYNSIILHEGNPQKEQIAMDFKQGISDMEQSKNEPSAY